MLKFYPFPWSAACLVCVACRLRRGEGSGSRVLCCFLWAFRARGGRVSRHGRESPGRGGCCETRGGSCPVPAAGRGRGVSPRDGGGRRPGGGPGGAGRARP